MNSETPEMEQWKPGVSRNVLLLIAGLLWMGIGIMLDGMAWSWLRIEEPSRVLLSATAGFACALVIHHFGFLRIVDRNLDRILPMEGKRCVFSFMPWKSYILIVIMVLAGYFLRHSPIPKPYLAVIYTGIGTALILSSVRYLRHLMMAVKKK